MKEEKKETSIMNNLKAKRVMALKQVGVKRKEVEDYCKSGREHFVQYRGREGKLITQELLSKLNILADVRRNM